jgi:hypothetical protein
MFKRTGVPSSVGSNRPRLHPVRLSKRRLPLAPRHSVTTNNSLLFGNTTPTTSNVARFVKLLNPASLTYSLLLSWTSCAVLTSVKYVACFQDTIYQDPAHLHKCSTKKFPHCKYITLLHHVSCVQKWLIWFCVVLLWFNSLMMDPCGQKHVEMFSAIFLYKYR